MFTARKKEKVSIIYSLTAAALFLASSLEAGNVIVNKSVISGSVVSGNVGIVINGKKVAGESLKPLNKSELKRVRKKIPCRVKKIVVALPDFSLKVRKEGKCYALLAKHLAKKGVFDKEEIKISDNHDISFPIEISLDSFDRLELYGDYKLDVAEGFEGLDVKSSGDGEVRVFSKAKSARFDVVGDFKIEFYDAVGRFYLDYTGDTELIFNKIEFLEIEGTGDVEVRAKEGPLKIKKDIVGDFEIKRD